MRTVQALPSIWQVCVHVFMCVGVLLAVLLFVALVDVTHVVCELRPEDGAGGAFVSVPSRWVRAGSQHD